MNGFQKNQGLPASPAMLWLIHCAFIMAIPTYGVMTATILAPMQHGTPPRQDNLMIAVLCVVAMLSLIGGLTANRWSPLFIRGNFTDDAKGFLMREQSRLIVGNAFFESIAVYGVAGIFLGLPLALSYAFMGVSLLALLARIAVVRGITDEYQRRKGAEE